MNHGPTKLFKRDVLVRHRFEYVWPRHKHVASLLHHKNKVGDGGGVDRAARAGSHNGRNLWHDARCQRVAQENISVGSQADHALLDARPAWVIQPNDGCTILHGMIHDFTDFLRVRLG